MSLIDELVAGAERRAAALRVPSGPPATAPRPFDAAIRGRDRLHVIAEFKRSSPSAPTPAREGDVAAQTARYAAAGASAISVLTEPERFRGHLDDLGTAARTTSLPVLMKDFVVAPEQVAAAAHAGASAVLLIVRCLSQRRLDELVATCAAYRLTPLVECRDERELDAALAHETAVVGVNNRDLETLRVNLSRARDLLPRVPDDRIAVAESGYDTPEAARTMRGLVDAVLVGSALMRSDDPATYLRAVLA